MLALGLMREGRGLNHVGYAFLSFYKILDAAFPADKQRITWISAAIAGLTGFGVKEALDGIRAQGITTPDGIGRHLYQSGRCAMAHGARKPIVDPDKKFNFALDFGAERIQFDLFRDIGVCDNQHSSRLAAWLMEIDGNDRVDRLPAGRVVFTHADPALA
jgi:hypothetical protein